MTRLLTQGAIAALLVALLAFTGCGGGDGGGEEPVAGDVGMLSGRVVHADDPSIVLSGATVTVRQPLGAVVATGATNSTGDFLIQNIPVGTYTVLAETGNEDSYGSQSVPNIGIVKNTRTELTITVLRSSDPTPTMIYLSPSSAKVDLNGTVDFGATVTSASGGMDVTPIYILSGDVGEIDRDGTFTGTKVGTAQVLALIGTISATAEIEVTAARDPQVTSFMVSPTQVAASGGKVYVTVSANDGDGITSVVAEIYTPGGDTVSRALTLNEASTDTYQLWTNGVLGLQVAANSNEPDGNGHQATQTYSLRVVVTDGSGATTTTDFVDLTVLGLDTPPTPG